MTDEILISYREMKQTIGRILFAKGLVRGHVYPVRDFLLRCQAHSQTGLAALRDAAELEAWSGTAVHTSGDHVQVDGGGFPLFVAAPRILDIAELLDRPTHMRIDDFTGAMVLPGLIHEIAAHGARAQVVGGQEQAFLEISLQPAVGEVATGGSSIDHELDLLVNGGYVAANLWAELSRLSEEALTPEFDGSQTHAGASIFDSDGRIVGDLAES